jgi:hypothetical protein
MSIEYQINAPVSTDQFIELLRESTLGERRPIKYQQLTCPEGLPRQADFSVHIFPSIA